jgi:hypothetical protein
MTRLAKWLPIAFVPEQDLIATMRNDVINYGGWYKCAILRAVRAKRMI